MEFIARTRVEGADDVPRYYDYLRGATIETPWSELPMLPLRSSVRGAQVTVPVDDITRQAIDAIETFVRSNIDIPAEVLALKKGPVYRSLYRGPTLFVSVHEDCNCFVFDDNSMPIEVDEDSPIFDFTLNKPFHIISLKQYKNRRARYKFRLNFSNVCIGPHASGSLVSINPCIHAIYIDY